MREANTCDKCGSTVRLRSLAWLISDELFGLPMVFPDFPTIKSWTAIGMSDVKDFAKPLQEKFSYTNTYYHAPPVFDITKPDPQMECKFDFIISSEVLEHVPVPVEAAFDTLYRMLKPNGVLFLTVPYSLEATTIEHFPELHDFSVTALKDRWVLVNRTRDGRLQTFDDLVFHGGPGSTLEMRVFNESTLRRILSEAGFESIRIRGESYPEFGILPDNPWSLPIAARKGKRGLDSAGLTEIASAYADLKADFRVAETHIARMSEEYSTHAEWAERKIRELEAVITELHAWGQGIEKNSDEHAAHVGLLQAELVDLEARREQLNTEFEERTAWALTLRRENEELTKRCEAYANNTWLRIGRRLRLAK